MKGVDGIIILASCECYCIRVQENLVQHPGNNIWIIPGRVISSLAPSTGLSPITSIEFIVLRNRGSGVPVVSKFTFPKNNYLFR